MATLTRWAPLFGTAALLALPAAPAAAQRQPNPPIETFIRAVGILDVSFPTSAYIVNAHQRTGLRTARVYLSAHGLEPGTRYQLVGSTRRCSQRRSTSAGRVFRLGFRTPEGSGDVFRSARVTLSLPLRRARTVSLLRVTDTLPTLGCAITGSYDSGTGTLT